MYFKLNRRTYNCQPSIGPSGLASEALKGDSAVLFGDPTYFSQFGKFLLDFSGFLNRLPFYGQSSRRRRRGIDQECYHSTL